MPIIAF